MSDIEVYVLNYDNDKVIELLNKDSDINNLCITALERCNDSLIDNFISLGFNEFDYALFVSSIRGNLDLVKKFDNFGIKNKCFYTSSLTRVSECRHFDKYSYGMHYGNMINLRRNCSTDGKYIEVIDYLIDKGADITGAFVKGTEEVKQHLIKYYNDKINVDHIKEYVINDIERYYGRYFNREELDEMIDEKLDALSNIKNVDQNIVSIPLEMRKELLNV